MSSPHRSSHSHDSAHSHAHAHGHAAGRGGHVLLAALIVTLGFAAVEAGVGWWAGSLALLGDAGHMFSDAMALGIAAFAAWLSKRPPSPRHSYGLARAEIVAALLNGVLMLAVVIGIVVEAVQRLRAPTPVAGGAVTLIAALGLAVNVAVLWLLSRGEHDDLNRRSAVLHVLGDLLGSVAALLAGAVVYFTGWVAIDPLLSLFICGLIVYSTFQLLREAVHVLMEGVPRHLSLSDVGSAMAQVPGTVSVHDLHIWTLASGRLALSAHVVVRDMGAWTVLLAQQRQLLGERFRIEHVTLQPEVAPEFKSSYVAVIPIHPHDHRH